MASQAALLVNGLHGETEGKGRPAAVARKPSRRLMSPEPGGKVSHSATNGVAQQQELGPHKQEEEVAKETKPEDSRSRSRREDPSAGKTEKREEEERGEESEEKERERDHVKNAAEEQVGEERDGAVEGRLESEQVSPGGNQTSCIKCVEGCHCIASHTGPYSQSMSLP